MPTPIDETADWEADAICREVDPELWFPEKGEHSKHASRLCAQCPVQGECLDAALERDERFGIWGGPEHPPTRPPVRPRRQPPADRMSTDTHPADVDADDLDLGRAADDLRVAGLSWPAIADQLDEPQVYVRRAHTAYLAHIHELAHRDQMELF